MFVELNVGATILFVVFAVVPNVTGAVVAGDPNNGDTVLLNPVVVVLNVRGFAWPKILSFALKTGAEEVVVFVLGFALENRLLVVPAMVDVAMFPAALKIDVDVVVGPVDDAGVEPKIGVVIVLLVVAAMVLPTLEPNNGALVVFGILKALDVPDARELPNNG